MHEVSCRLHALGHKLATDSAEGGLDPQDIQRRLAGKDWEAGDFYRCECKKVNDMRSPLGLLSSDEGSAT